jgi:hypothetical protein
MWKKSVATSLITGRTIEFYEPVNFEQPIVSGQIERDLTFGPAERAAIERSTMRRMLTRYA